MTKFSSESPKSFLTMSSRRLSEMNPYMPLSPSAIVNPNRPAHNPDRTRSLGKVVSSNDFKDRIN